MKLRTLMYHGIVAKPTGDRYDTTLEDLKRHLNAIRARAPGAPAAPTAPGQALEGFALTFDDGFPGWLSAGDALAELGWKGVFFVVTSWIDRPGQLTRDDIRRLAAQGHVIGSHSVDHPDLMHARDLPYVRRQWARSKAELEAILGAPVLCASVPGGFYSPRVARAAAQAGLSYLFTSEPLARASYVEDCAVLGRYALFAGASAQRAADLACGAAFVTARHYVFTRLKNGLKRRMPNAYLAARRAVFGTPGIRIPDAAGPASRPT